MTFFLDFDRTLFDTDALIAYMKEQENTKDIYLLENDDAIKQELARRAESGAIVFAPNELVQFLYPDVEHFVHAHNVIAITSGFASFQELKVRNVLSHITIDVWYTERISKGQYLKEKLGPNTMGVFVDDRLTELDSMVAHAPRIRVFEMRRDGKEGSGKYPVVHNLAELEAAVLK